MTQESLSVLYRGDLSSCNYDCSYCPFAKRRDTRETLARDAADLARFVDWAGGQTQASLNILFTPWGEALTRKYYREALITLSQLPQVRRVAIQTNLSTAPAWLERGQTGKISLWCTYHPTETNRERFLRRVRQLEAAGAPHSVGMVGIRGFFPELASLRQALPASTYLWINAYHDEGANYYRAHELAWLSGIDPWFSFNAHPAPSRNVSCQAGETAITVDGRGDIRRCHFVPQTLGNIYAPDWQQALQRRTCSIQVCDCYIGYVQQDSLPFQTSFGVGALGRVPQAFNWQAPEAWSPAGPTPEKANLLDTVSV